MSDRFDPPRSAAPHTKSPPCSMRICARTAAAISSSSAAAASSSSLAKTAAATCKCARHAVRCCAPRRHARTSAFLLGLGSRRTIFMLLTPSVELLPAACTDSSTVVPTAPRRHARSLERVLGQGASPTRNRMSWGCRKERAGHPSRTCTRVGHRALARITRAAHSNLEDHPSTRALFDVHPQPDVVCSALRRCWARRR